MKRILALFPVFFLLCPFSASALSPDPWEVYAPVRTMYLFGLSGDEQVLENEAFNFSSYQDSLTAGLDPYEAVGYAFEGLDMDGSPELIIGQIPSDEENGYLYDIWTFREAPVCLAQGWARNHLCLTQETDGFGVYQEGANSAFESVWSRGQFVHGGIAWLHELTALTESSTVWTLDGKQVSEKEADILLNAWQAPVIFPVLTPFSQLSSNDSGG